MVVLINRQIKQLFELPSPQELRAGELPALANWNVRSAEKVMRVVHFLSFFLAGLSKPRQNVVWISDQDEIAPNPARLSDLTTVFSTVAGSYLGYDLGHMRVGTTESDSVDRQIEDLAAIPDLAAGALTHAFGEYQLRGGIARSGLVLPPPDSLQPKAREIMNWHSDERMILRPLVVMIERADEAGHVIVRLVQLEGRRSVV